MVRKEKAVLLEFIHNDVRTLVRQSEPDFFQVRLREKHAEAEALIEKAEALDVHALLKLAETLEFIASQIVIGTKRKPRKRYRHELNRSRAFRQAAREIRARIPKAISST